MPLSTPRTAQVHPLPVDTILHKEHISVISLLFIYLSNPRTANKIKNPKIDKDLQPTAYFLKSDIYIYIFKKSDLGTNDFSAYFEIVQAK
jgi:hypothetical protein